MPLPKPKSGESEDAFISRCMSDEMMVSEYPDEKQRTAICYSQFKGKAMNDTLLQAIRNRGRKQTFFGYGIMTADRYVKTVQDAAGLDACYRYLSKGGTSFNDLMVKAARTLVYCNPDMVVSEKRLKPVGLGVDLPKNTLMVFRHTLTTSTKDRDGDVLHSEGAVADPKMLLLWQHVHTMPIGKMLKIYDQDADKLQVVSCIVDMNELSHDAAVMVDNDMGRFSHGFRAIEFTENKAAGDEPGAGFDIKRFEIMEESLVSVPANVDAQCEEVLLSLVEGGKLTSPLMKQYGRGIRDRRSVQVPGVRIKYRERLGDSSIEVVCGSLSDLKAVADAGIIGGQKNENESRSGTEAGAEGRKASASEKADAETSDNQEVKPEDDEVTCPECEWKGALPADGKCPECGYKLTAEQKEEEKPAEEEKANEPVETKAEDEPNESDDEGPECPKCGSANVVDGVCQECGYEFPDETGMGEEEKSTKQGRVLSTSNEKKIKDAFDDLNEAVSLVASSPAPRGAVALIRSAIKALDEVLKSVAKLVAEKNPSVLDAMSQCVIECNAGQRRSLLHMLKAIDDADYRKQITEQYRRITDGRGGL